MQIIKKSVHELVSDPNNARTHNTKNIEAIKGSLLKFGQQKPIVINKDNIVLAGNGTLQAARELSWSEIDVVVSELNEFNQAAFALADNKTAELAEWDLEQLGATLDSLAKVDFDVSAIGFDLDDVPSLNEPKEGLTDDDAVPEVEENIYGVELGDVWKLGEHRVMCGDSTSKENVEKLMAGEKADMVFTDPPYGMFLNADFSKGMTLKGGKPMAGKHSKLGHKGYKHENVIGDHDDFKPEFISTALSFGAKEVFLWGADYYADLLPDRNSGSWIIWDKRVKNDGEAINQAMTTSEFETCWSKNKHQRLVCRMVHSGICSVENDKRVHPTQKPTKLAIWFFDRWGKDKKLIVDIFLGSGSTLIACEKTNRKCYGMELDPHYCSVIIKRWEDFTGQKAERL